MSRIATWGFISSVAQHEHAVESFRGLLLPPSSTGGGVYTEKGRDVYFAKVLLLLPRLFVKTDEIDANQMKIILIKS